VLRRMKSKRDRGVRAWSEPGESVKAVEKRLNAGTGNGSEMKPVAGDRREFRRSLKRDVEKRKSKKILCIQLCR
jgi:hypothetical protein